MKLFLILLLLTLLQAETTADGNLRPIRKTERGTLVYRLDDGTNTCYVVDTDRYQGLRADSHYNRAGSVNAGISCVKR